MKEERKLRDESNAGYCFVITKFSADSVPLHHNDEFQKALLKMDNTDKIVKCAASSEPGAEETIELDFREVESNKPYMEKDILWENLDSNRWFRGFIQFVLLILLLVFFLILMTPANLLNQLNSIGKKLNGKKDNKKNFI